MIKLATKETLDDLRKIWKTVFDDDDKYLDLYFDKNILPENSLIYYVDDKPAASLNMVKYDFAFYDEIIPCYYLTALATYPEHRRKGYMDALINEAHLIMYQRSIPLTILIPGEEWLYNFYTSYGFAQTFDANKDVIELKKIWDKTKNIDDAFALFDEKYNKGSFMIKKSKRDFEIILEEQKIYDFESKTLVDGMSRVINPSQLLRIFAKNNPKKKFTLRILGDKQLPQNNAYYTIEDGTVSKFNAAKADIEVTINEFSQLILGYNNDDLPPKFYFYFPKHKPTLSLMLD